MLSALQKKHVNGIITVYWTVMYSLKSIKEDGRMKKFISVVLAVIIMLSFAGVHAEADEGSVRGSAPESDSVTVISDENEADSSHKIVTETDEDDIDELPFEIEDLPFWD